MVSILIPAYNEDEVIAAAIENALEIEYPNKEVIVIPKIKLLRKPNGGKSSALNYGMLFSKGEIIVTIDADGRVGRDCVTEIVKRFQDEKVKACGNIKVHNLVNLLTNCQALEYVVSINISETRLRCIRKRHPNTWSPGCPATGGASSRWSL